MHIDKLLRTVLTNKGILKNDIKDKKVDWLTAKEMYSKIYSPQLTKSRSLDRSPNFPPIVFRKSKSEGVGIGLNFIQE